MLLYGIKGAPEIDQPFLIDRFESPTMADSSGETARLLCLMNALKDRLRPDLSNDVCAQRERFAEALIQNSVEFGQAISIQFGPRSQKTQLVGTPPSSFHLSSTAPSDGTNMNVGWVDSHRLRNAASAPQGREIVFA